MRLLVPMLILVLSFSQGCSIMDELDNANAEMDEFVGIESEEEEVVEQLTPEQLLKEWWKTAKSLDAKELSPSIVNPIAMILTAAMLLDHVGEASAAERVRAVVGQVVQEGRVRSYDMMKLSGGAEALHQGAATTQQMTDAIVAAL